MVVAKASGALGALALGAGVLIATPAAAGTFGTMAGTNVSAATQCIGVGPTYGDVLVRRPWTETIEHGGTWVTEARYTRWVVDQPYKPAVPEVSHEEREWSREPLEGWTATEESRFVVTQPGTPAIPEVAEVTEQRMIDPGQSYVAPSVELVQHDAVYRTEHHDAVYRTEHHEAVYKTVHHPAVIEYEFRQKNGNVTHWSTDPNWNAQGNPNSQGFEATGVSQERTPAWDEQVLVTAAWDEEVLVTEAWDEQVLEREAWTEVRVLDPGQPYVAPTYETVVVVPYQPAVPAVPEQGYTEHEYSRRVVTQEAEPEVEEIGHLEERWATAAPGDGWEATGETRQVPDRAPWTEEIHHPAVYETRMTDPGVTCPAPGGGTGGTGGRPATTVPVNLAGPAAASASEAKPAALPSTGATAGMLAVAGVAVVSGAALIAIRALSGLGLTTAAAGPADRRPFRRRADRRTD